MMFRVLGTRKKPHALFIQCNNTGQPSGSRRNSIARARCRQIHVCTGASALFMCHTLALSRPRGCGLRPDSGRLTLPRLFIADFFCQFYTSARATRTNNRALRATSHFASSHTTSTQKCRHLGNRPLRPSGTRATPMAATAATLLPPNQHPAPCSRLPPTRSAPRRSWQ